MTWHVDDLKLSHMEDGEVAKKDDNILDGNYLRGNVPCIKRGNI
jgi:hypothetical protein